jgi:ligand-binding sensor domain-containing protein
MKLDVKTKQNTIFNTYNSEIPNNQVNCIFIDKDGAKWIGTDSGIVAKYDNSKWIQYFLCDNECDYRRSINSIVQTSNGTIWVGIDYYGVAAINSGKVQLFFRDSAQLKGEFQLLIDLKGRLWCRSHNEKRFSQSYEWGGHGDGIEDLGWFAFYSDTGWVVIDSTYDGLPGETQLSLIPTADSSILIPAWKEKVIFRDSMFCPILQDRPAFINTGRVLFDGTVLLGGVYLYHYDKNFNLLDTLRTSEKSFDEILQISEGRESQYSLIRSEKGLFECGKNKCTEIVIPKSGYPDSIEAMTTDKNGTIWVLSDQVGIYSWKKGVWHFIPFKLPKGTSQKILKYTSIAIQSDSLIWVGTYDGLLYYNNKELNFSSDTNVSHESISSITLDAQNRLWVAAGNGVYMQKDSSFLKMINVDWDQQVTCVNSINIDSHGFAYFDHASNVYVFDINKRQVVDSITRFLTTNPDYDPFIYQVSTDNQREKVYIITDMGIISYKNGTWSYVLKRRLLKPTLSVMCFDTSNKPWVYENETGFVYYDGKNWIPSKYYNNCLGKQKISYMQFDGENNLWVTRGNWEIDVFRVFNK